MGEVLYLSADAEDLRAHPHTYEAPFNKLGEKDLCPGSGCRQDQG